MFDVDVRLGSGCVDVGEDEIDETVDSENDEAEDWYAEVDTNKLGNVDLDAIEDENSDDTDAEIGTTVGDGRMRLAGVDLTETGVVPVKNEPSLRTSPIATHKLASGATEGINVE